MEDPNKALLDMLQPNGLKALLFPATSRYYGLDTAKLSSSDYKNIIYIKRRFLPPVENFELLEEHAVTEGERLDNITAHYLGDPEQFWRICDANRAKRPDELTETVGRRLRITLPEGIPGVPND